MILLINKNYKIYFKYSMNYFLEGYSGISGINIVYILEQN